MSTTKHIHFSRRDLLRLAGSSAVLPLSPAARADQPAILKPSLGINLAAVNYWMSERPFVNLYHTSSPLVSNTRGGQWNDGPPLQQDVDGWLTRLEPTCRASFLIDLKRGHRNTAYEISYDGPGDAVRISGARDNIIDKQTAEIRLLVHIDKPVRNIVIRERNEPSPDLFASPFLERCRRFSTLRFMDWLRTNEDRPVAWSTRVTDRYYTQAGTEVALEHLVELCNQTSSAMWYCVHHRAGDAYVRHVARLLKRTLKTSQPVYLEHSNEVWNRSFPQHDYCQEQGGVQEKGSAPGWLKYHVERTRRAAELFRREGVDIVCVLGLQAVNLWTARQFAGLGVPAGIDAIAIAPYFGGSLGRDRELVEKVSRGGIDVVLRECRESIRRRRENIRQHQTLADSLQLRLLGYEGGQHLLPSGRFRGNRELLALFRRANRAPEMYDLYREYLDGWATETGDGLLCLYNSCGLPSRSGSWGLMEYDGQPLDQAPKYRAVRDYLQQTR